MHYRRRPRRFYQSADTFATVVDNEYYVDFTANTQYISTPDSAALSITGDLELEVDMALDDYTTGFTTCFLLHKGGTGGQDAYGLILAGDSAPYLIWYPDGWTQNAKGATANLLTVISNTDRVRLKATLDVDNGAAGHDVEFWYSTDDGGSYTQLGSTVTTAGTTSILDTPESLYLGGYPSATAPNGKVYQGSVRSGIDGSLVADCHLGVYATAGQTDTDTFADGQGNTWTITGAITVT